MRVRLLISFFGLAMAVGLSGAEPLNVSRAKAAAVDYFASGAYLAGVQAVADTANVWLEERVAQRRDGERLLVVFDIDETVLSNYRHIASQDFGYVSDVWEHWVDRAAAPPLEPVREVYRRARALGVAVVFLTGRHEAAEREGTLANLVRTAMDQCERVIFRTAADTAPTAAGRKAAARAQLEEAGWTIVASVGDQPSDLAGGHAERTFKLPNPFYEIP